MLNNLGISPSGDPVGSEGFFIGKYEVARAIGLELMAAIMPSCHLLLIKVPFGAVTAMAAQLVNRAKKMIGVPEKVPVEDTDRFIVDDLDDAP